MILCAYITSKLSIALRLNLLTFLIIISIILTKHLHCCIFDSIQIFLTFISFSILGYIIAKKIEEYDEQNRMQRFLLEKMTMIDFLTETFNRRAFFKLSQSMINAAKRKHEKLGILMMDLDYFKKVNDTYGHDAGDIVLREFSHKIKTIIRENDLFARIGGEEFVVLLDNMGLHELNAVAKKIKSVIENSEIPINNNKKIKITVSIGTYLFDPNTEDLNSAIIKADKALYKAKLFRNAIFNFNKLKFFK
jgi:diguanylate cyclase (GGDEF)-like protein